MAVTRKWWIGVACALAMAAPARAMEPYMLGRSGEEHARITVKVDTDAGEKLDHVHVVLEGPDGNRQAWELPLEDNQRVIVGEFDEGRYRLSITAPGHESAQTSFEVAHHAIGTDVIQLNLKLVRMVMARPPIHHPPMPPMPAAPPPAPPAADREEAPIPMPPQGATAGDGDAESPYGIVRVFYATDRNATGDPRPSRCYGDQLVDVLTYGTAFVSVPKFHHVMGRLERPSLLHLEFHENPDKHVVVQKVDACDSTTYFGKLRMELAAPSHPRLLLYVHGFNVDFQGAMLRAGQMAYDLDLPIVPVAFSWASLGKTDGYSADETTVELAAEQVRQFILALRRETGVHSIDVIAHSMGARAIGYALADLARSATPSDTLVEELIFAAPDVDQRKMARWIDTFRPMIGRVTLYGSARDRAMWASGGLHNFPRAGDGGAHVFVHAGVETIDATNVPTDFISHEQPGDGAAVTSDAYYVLRHTAVDKRCCLARLTSHGLAYWEMKPQAPH